MHSDQTVTLSGRIFKRLTQRGNTTSFMFDFYVCLILHREPRFTQRPLCSISPRKPPPQYPPIGIWQLILVLIWLPFGGIWLSWKGGEGGGGERGFPIPVPVHRILSLEVPPHESGDIVLESTTTSCKSFSMSHFFCPIPHTSELKTNKLKIWKCLPQMNYAPKNIPFKTHTQHPLQCCPDSGEPWRIPIICHLRFFDHFFWFCVLLKLRVVISHISKSKKKKRIAHWHLLRTPQKKFVSNIKFWSVANLLQIFIIGFIVDSFQTVKFMGYICVSNFTLHSVV